MVPNPECAQSKTIQWYKNIETLRLIKKNILLFSLMEACCIVCRTVRECMLFCV